MKIVALSAYNEYYAELNKASEKSKADYFRINGIRFENMNLFDLNDYYGRPFSWVKIKAIQFGLVINDYVLWLDCDTCILKQDFDIKALFSSGKEIYISKDVNGINCGVMAFKNTNKVKSILSKVWSMEEYINHIWWEQAALMKLYEDNFEGINEITEFVPQKVFNAYEYKMYGREYTRGQICEDTFIAHFPALPRAERIELINKYTKK